MIRIQGVRNGFQSRGVMEHRKALSATMAGRQEKKLNSRLSRTAKSVAF